MSPAIRLCLVLHNHQPVGNFEHVFEQAYQDSYLPFLEVFEEYQDLKLTLHTSGPLMEWLDAAHSDYVDRLAQLVAAGRLEILGGAFYEPILTMIPSEDREGQIRTYTAWLENRLGGQVRGIWTPERVWEQSLTSNLAAAGVQYTLLDDSHFHNAGLSDNDLHGYYITEDEGALVSVFPGSERLRYLIPFAEPHETIDHLRHVAHQTPNAIAVFGDDGEKFGTWPDTRRHVYENGWLRRFFDALVANADWLKTTTLADVVEETPPLGKVYLPAASYREMTEWSLPVESQHQYEHACERLRNDGSWDQARHFLRGGFWRNFKVKYDESNEMYARMMAASRRLREATVRQEEQDSDLLELARQALYRGQCNCSYWHGAFGGIYLPHLRNAVYENLIQCDNLLDEAAERPPAYVEASVQDFNFDACQEIRLASDQFICWFAPISGGVMYELDVRRIRQNLLATLQRRPEAYHQKVLAGAQDNDGVSSIHDRVVFKQEGLDKMLQYDAFPRKSLVDHFYDEGVGLEAVRTGAAEEKGDFVNGAFDAKLRRNPQCIQVQMSRQGAVSGIPIRLTKGVTMHAGGESLEIAFLIEGLPRDQVFQFAPEFNFAAMPADADERFFFQGEQRLGHLGQTLDLDNHTTLGLADHWLGVEAEFRASQPTSWWTFPIATVSQSEGGFELVHQSVCVQPHWLVQADTNGRWSAKLELNLNCGIAAQREAKAETAANVG